MSNARQLAANLPREGGLSNRNLIINGAMQVAQRGTSFTGITNAAASYTLDRFFSECATSAGVTLSATQSSDAPLGFNNSVSIAVTTSGATSSGDYTYFRQNVEGYNASHLNFGSSDAQTVTLSFWVKSSVTGTFGGWLGAASNARFYIYSYTINSANTWEYKTITVSGDTSGTWNTTNGVGLQVAWSLSCGSTYLGATGSWSSSLFLGATGQTNITETASATWQITGVQLEVGDTATPFEHRSIGQELEACRRYYRKINAGARIMNNGRNSISYPLYPVMRVSPTNTLDGYNIEGGQSMVWQYPSVGADYYMFDMSSSAVNYTWWATVSLDAEL